MSRPIRRVVTGHDANGVATVIMNSDATCFLSRPNRPGLTLTNLWQNDKMPAAMERHDDPVDGPLKLQPPKKWLSLPHRPIRPREPGRTGQAGW